MLATLAIVLPLLTFLAFCWWWGGRSTPLSPAEIDEGLRQLQATDTSEHGRAAVAQVRQLLTNDDGREFLMLNLVRHRPKALYPAGLDYGDDAKAADRRYGKSIVWDLLRNGNLMVFIAPRVADFIVPDGADRWHYVALVRYRSRRDFLRFAQQSSRADKFVHKWAAIEKTHVFAVRPLFSLLFVRGTVGMVMALVSMLAFQWAR